MADESDVVIVDSKTEHDNAIEEHSQNQNSSNDDEKKGYDETAQFDKLFSKEKEKEAEIREMGSLTSLISIKFDEETYVALKHKKDEFVLYKVSISFDTDSKTSFPLYLRYSDVDRFHRKLTYFHNRLCKFNPSLKQSVILPKSPPKKQWQRNKLDTAFVSERIRLLNIYANEITKYVTKSTAKIQELYLRFFEISAHNSIYKYVINNDTRILQELYTITDHSLLFNDTIDDNKANILHYIISQNAIVAMQWVINTLDSDRLGQLLSQSDQYGITPLALLSQLQTEKNETEMCNLLSQSCDIPNPTETNMQKIPVQYTCNILTKQRKLWIIVNPFAGPGKAMLIWSEFVQKFLDFNADIFEYEILITEAQFDAQKQCESMDLETYNSYDGIVCIGGDGTIAEIVNGFYNNSQISVRSIPILPIAAGSGNALAKELSMENMLECLKKLLNGFETVIDAYIASQMNEKDTYSFVSTQWGAISTIDLESESFRWMGSLRFTLKAVSEIAFSAFYKARVYYKCIGSDGDSDESDTNWWHSLPQLQLSSKSSTAEDKEDSKGDSNENESEESESKTSETVPDHPKSWECVSGEFGLLCVTNLQWIAEDTNMGGQGFDARTNTLRLIYNLKTGRFNYASALLGLDNGTHIDLEYVKWFDVSEAVIEPLNDGPPIDVDGERKPLKPVHVRILPSDFVVIC